jgi:hypothetical protein
MDKDGKVIAMVVGALIGAGAVVAVISESASAKDITVTVKGDSVLAVSGRWEALPDGGVSVIENYIVRDSVGSIAHSPKASYVTCEAPSLSRGACLTEYNRANGF